MTSSTPVLLLCSPTRKPGLLLLLFLTSSTLLLWVSVVALSGDDKSTTTNLTTTTLHLFTPKPLEARNGNSISSPTSAALKPAETFNRGSVVATFDEETGATAAFADGWVEVDEEENVAQEILGSGGKHKILGETHYHLLPPHSRPHSQHSKFASLEDHQQQSYECVLMPKLRPTYSEAANTAEMVDDLINAGHHQVHHLYGVDVEEEDGDENGVHSHRHQKATKRRAKSTAASVSTATTSTSKLRDFGNFLYVDDTARPSYSSLDSMEFVTSSPPPPSSSKQKTKKGHRKSSNKKHGSSGSKELNQLFSSLKNSLDQLLCYQNEECYGGEMGGEMSGRDGEEKLEAFIRHVRASKRVFEMLERNRHRLMEVAASNKDSSEEEMTVYPHPEPGRPAGPLHLPNRFTALDPRDLINGGPVVPLYDDTVQRSMAVKAPPQYRKLNHGHSVGKYLKASSIVPPPPVPSASIHQHQRRLPARSLVSPSGFDSFSPSSSSSLLPSKLGRHLIGSLLSSGANLLMSRASLDGSGGGGGGWQPKRQWAQPSSAASPAAASSVYRPSITSGWPNPVLVIKEYEEYNE